MTDNEFLLFDRITKIKSVIEEYGEENFYISFSGGKDSTVLSALVDMALPNNQIPRVYANTGIEYKMIRDFVKAKAEKDDRVVMLVPKIKIQTMLKEVGYPFKSKWHSRWVSDYQRRGMVQSVCNYLGNEKKDKDSYRPCPKILKYQFSEDFKLKISDQCCVELKEKPMKKWAKENKKPYSIIGVMRDEGGRREFSKCLAFSGDKLKAFQPLVPITKEWEEWFIKEYSIDICDIYKPPYNFERTGCKGCPYNLNLKKDLKTMQKYFPHERKQCEIIWKPVYDEYRRIGYRLKQYEQMNIFDLGITEVEDVNER